MHLPTTIELIDMAGKSIIETVRGLCTTPSKTAHANVKSELESQLRSEALPAESTFPTPNLNAYIVVFVIAGTYKI
ncbi:hypothetical protein C5167_042877 [Papaver somniferum]|uniref:Uncharacterized protein n=1 Tax=Papaver somniferum TaxID=3469 RepID=A0A4Y7L7E4_PAPSO|nr:hypothetical protein C5167_042877 [Papaver somniferum]